MKTMLIKGIRIKTNLWFHYPKGNGKSTSTLKAMTIKSGESDTDFVKRLAMEGYRYIALHTQPTSMIYALVK